MDNGPSRDSSLVVERVLFQVRQSQFGARPAGDRGNDVQLKKGGAGPGTNAPCVPSLPLAWHLVAFQDRITYQVALWEGEGGAYHCARRDSGIDGNGKH